MLSDIVTTRRLARLYVLRKGGDSCCYGHRHWPCGQPILNERYGL